MHVWLWWCKSWNLTNHDGLVSFGSQSRTAACNLFQNIWLLQHMPVWSKPIKHMMPESDEQVLEERMGTHPCIWQIKVVCKVLEGNNIIAIAATGSGKTFTYWMLLLYVKHGIVPLITPLKLLGKQFINVLATIMVTATSNCCSDCSDSKLNKLGIQSRMDAQWQLWQLGSTLSTKQDQAITVSEISRFAPPEPNMHLPQQVLTVAIGNCPNIKVQTKYVQAHKITSWTYFLWWMGWSLGQGGNSDLEKL